MAQITFAHARDHAVVVFSGALDWDATQELVDLVDVLVDEYFYTDVELVVTSDGGLVRAFEHYLARQEEWRRRGVMIRTRVVSEAASAAAILVSLGDERVAEPGATLAFHCLQAAPNGPVNAGTTAAISSALRGMDDAFVRRLAERGLRGQAAVAHGSERTDSVLLPQLWPEFGHPDKGVGVLGKRGKLARALGRHVDRAIRRQDRKALARLYRRLFEIDCTISARLALTLRLIDRIGVPSPTGAEAARSSGLTVPEWGVLFPPDGLVPREVLCRHAFVLGETGSGKTASCILPVAAAMARAPRAQLGAALIIDPKRELAPTLRGLAPGRVHEVRADRVVLDIMSGPRWSLRDDLAARRWVSAARRILCRVASFVPSSPAAVLVRHEASASSDNRDFFDREGTSLALAVLAFVLMVIDPRTPAPGDWLGDGDDVDAYVWAEDLVERARGHPGPNLRRSCGVVPRRTAHGGSAGAHGSGHVVGGRRGPASPSFPVALRPARAGGARAPLRGVPGGAGRVRADCRVLGVDGGHRQASSRGCARRRRRFSRISRRLRLPRPCTSAASPGTGRPGRTGTGSTSHGSPPRARRGRWSCSSRPGMDSTISLRSH